MTEVPFLDLSSLHLPLMDKFADATHTVINSNRLILGTEVEEFEREFAQYCGAKYAVGVGNGLDALSVLLKAHNVGVGDEVIVPTNTFIATWIAVTMIGATPVPVEPDTYSFNIDPQLVAKSITPKTRAIIAVHLYGRPADMVSLRKIAHHNSILLIEDAAQAHGARMVDGNRVGSNSDGAAFSFYPGKNLGALGDGGAIVCNDAKIYELAKKIRNYGSDEKYIHTVIGGNTRLDELQAAYLRVKLPYLDEWNMTRREIAKRYLSEIYNPLITLPEPYDQGEHVWHLFVVRTRFRQKLVQFLNKHQISATIHYPIPPHLQDCYKCHQSNEFPLAEELSREVLSLPIFPTMTIEQVDKTIAVLNMFEV